MIAGVDIGDLKAAVLVSMTSGPQHMPRPLYSSAILIFRIDFLRKNLRPFLSFRAFSLFCGTFFVDEDPFSHYSGWPSA